jgi:hypothetical protein
VPAAEQGRCSHSQDTVEGRILLLFSCASRLFVVCQQLSGARSKAPSRRGRRQTTSCPLNETGADTGRPSSGGKHAADHRDRQRIRFPRAPASWHRLPASQGRGDALVTYPCRETGDPRLLGIRWFGHRFMSGVGCLTGADQISTEQQVPISLALTNCTARPKGHGGLWRSAAHEYRNRY